MKNLLQLLLDECIKRDFKSLCSDGQLHYVGMCSIVEDLRDEGLITVDDYSCLKSFLAANKPLDASDSGYWYKDNSKRIEFLKRNTEL